MALKSIAHSNFFGSLQRNTRINSYTMNKWCIKLSASKRDLQHITGSLSWAAKPRVARPLLRHLIDICKNLQRRSHRVRLSADVCDDLRRWGQFLVSDRFNGVALCCRKQAAARHHFLAGYLQFWWCGMASQGETSSGPWGTRTGFILTLRRRTPFR